MTKDNEPNPATRHYNSVIELLQCVVNIPNTFKVREVIEILRRAEAAEPKPTNIRCSFCTADAVGTEDGFIVCSEHHDLARIQGKKLREHALNLRENNRPMPTFTAGERLDIQHARLADSLPAQAVIEIPAADYAILAKRFDNAKSIVIGGTTLVPQKAKEQETK